MNNNLEALYHQFLDVVEKGGVEEAKAFLVDHLNDFPDDLQREVVFSLFEGGLEEAARRKDVIEATDVVAQGIEKLGRIRNKIRDQLKILSIEKGLAQS